MVYLPTVLFALDEGAVIPLIPVLAAVLSNVLYGIAVDRVWNYVIIVGALLLNVFAFYSIAIVGTVWVTEAFPRWAAPGIVVVYGISYMTFLLKALVGGNNGF